jgi:hypothetical protein
VVLIEIVISEVSVHLPRPPRRVRPESPRLQREPAGGERGGSDPVQGEKRAAQLKEAADDANPEDGLLQTPLITIKFCRSKKPFPSYFCKVNVHFAIQLGVETMAIDCL